MVLGPAFGVLVVGAFTRSGLLDSNDKVIRFVSVLFSAVPTATTQVRS
jgi:hypothetical protein